MMVTIHGLPTNTKYQYLREVIKQECKVSDFILDNLLPDGNGSLKVRVGLANDFEGNQVIKCLNGYCFMDHILQVTAVNNSGNFQSQQQNPFLMGQASVAPRHNQLQWKDVQLQHIPQPNYEQMNSYGPSALNQPLMNQYGQRTSVYDRIGPLAQDFSVAQKNASQKIVAPAMAPGQEQLQWSANVDTYQNNIPFYQQQPFKSQDASTFELDACASGSQGRRGDIQHPNVSYPEKTAHAGSFDKNSQYQWVKGSDMHESRSRDTAFRGHRDGHKGRINRNDQSHTMEDRNRRVNTRPGNRERGENRDQYGNSDRDGNRYRDRNRDRDGNRDHKGKCDRDGYRDRDGNRDRDSSRDHGASRDRLKYRDDNPNPGVRPAFSCHDSARYNNNSDMANSRESRWDTHVRNQKEFAYKPLKITVDNEQFQTSPHSIQNSSSMQSEFMDKHPVSRKFGYMKNDQLSNEDRRIDSPHEPYQDKTRKRKYDAQKDTKALVQARNMRPKLAPPKKKLKPSVSKEQNATNGYHEILSKRMNRHTTLVQQVASSVAKGVFDSVGKSPTDNRSVFVELKKCIQNRINMIYGSNLANTRDEIVAEYNNEFGADQNHQLYRSIEEISANKTNINHQSAKVKMETATAEAQAKNVSGTESTGQQTPPSREPVSASGNVSLLPEVPTRVAPDIKLSNYPPGEQKQAMRFGVLLDLPDPYKSIVKQHMKDIEIMATECCKEVDTEIGASNIHHWQDAVRELKKVLRMNVTKRILDVRSELTVCIFYKQTMPNLEMLEAFLKEYDVISMNKLHQKKMIVVHCGTYKGFDNLCKLKTTVIDNISVTLNPLHLVGKPRRPRGKNAKMVVQPSDSESDNEKSITDCQRDILNDSDVVLLESEREVIDLDTIESKDDLGSGSKDTIIESNRDGNRQTPSSVANKDVKSTNVNENKCEQSENVDNGTKDEESKANTKLNQECYVINNDQKALGPVHQNQDGERNKEKDSDTSILNNDDKRDSPSLIVGDHSYVVLDDADDEHPSDSNNIANTEDIAEDIDEEDLEDF